MAASVYVALTVDASSSHPWSIPHMVNESTELIARLLDSLDHGLSGWWLLT
jgi:hypothetical protein